MLGYIRYTDQNYINYYDGFFHMRKMEEAWILNMTKDLNSSWIIIFDKSIMEWFKKYAPGFMCVGHKPHPFSVKGALFLVV